MTQSNEDTKPVLKPLPATLLALGLLFVPGQAPAQSLDLEAVKLSLSFALRETAAVSREEGRYVLPLRTNLQLETISSNCKTILRENDPSNPVPPICRPVRAPVEEFNGFGIDFVGNQS